MRGSWEVSFSRKYLSENKEQFWILDAAAYNRKSVLINGLDGLVY